MMRLDNEELKLFEDPWYHDFEILGLKTPQKVGIFALNQQSKQDLLFGLIERAILLCKEQGRSARGVELFCADGLLELRLAAWRRLDVWDRY